MKEPKAAAGTVDCVRRRGLGAPSVVLTSSEPSTLPQPLPLALAAILINVG